MLLCLPTYLLSCVCVRPHLDQMHPRALTPGLPLFPPAGSPHSPSHTEIGACFSRGKIKPTVPGCVLTGQTVGAVPPRAPQQAPTPASSLRGGSCEPAGTAPASAGPDPLLSANVLPNQEGTLRPHIREPPAPQNAL